jgi:ATP-binding cassette subfamily B protein
MVFTKTLKMPMQYYDEHHSGEMIAMSVYDTDVASNIYSSRLRRVIAPIISVFVFVVAMFIINPIMAMIMLAINIVFLY